MGKSEFLEQDLIPAAQKSGLLTAYLNLWDVGAGQGGSAGHTEKCVASSAEGSETVFALAGKEGASTLQERRRCRQKSRDLRVIDAK